MRRLPTLLAALGSGLVLALACIEDKSGNLFPDLDVSLAGSPGVGGGGGSAGTGGSGGSGTGGGPAGAGGSAGSSDLTAGNSGDGGLPDAGCRGALDCDDQNACTLERCESGVCAAAGFAAAGTACGSPSSGECDGADQCDGNGQCSPNNVAAGTECGNATEDECAHHDVCGSGVCRANDEPNGTACTDGSCTEGLCIDGQAVGCPVDVANRVPFQTSWSSVGRPNLFGGSCDSGGTPEYALVFTAPQAGTFRFTVHALVDGTPYTGADTSDPVTEPPDGDAVITVADGSCAGQGSTPLGCNDDMAPGSNIDAQLELLLTDQQAVTVYLNERTQTGGGTGTLSITLVP